MHINRESIIDAALSLLDAYGLGDVTMRRVASSLGVAPGVGGPLDLVAHGVTGYHFDPDRSGDLRRWSTALVEDAALRESMGAAGLERVRNRSWSALTEQLVGHYATTIDEHRTAA